MTNPTSGPESGRKIGVTAELAARFWERVEKPDTCWRWDGAISRQGYGTLTIPGMRGPVPAHRVAYAVIHGECPAGMVIMHSCDNKWCVNPDHLEAGSQAKNMADARERGLLDRLFHPTECRKCGGPIESGHRCPKCLWVTKAERKRVGRGRTVSKRKSVVGEHPTQSWEELVALVGERRAICFARNFGFYDHPVPEPCTDIARDLGLSRERVRQLVTQVAKKLGRSTPTFWTNAVPTPR